MKKFLSAAVTHDGPMFHSAVSALVPTHHHDVEETAEPVIWNLPGFLGSARVSTSFGDLPIEALRLRDNLRTALGAIAPVKWIDKLHLDEDFLTKHPGAQPVRISANTFGPGRPARDLTVSPVQTVCLDPHVPTRFVQASDLCAQGRARRVITTGLTYYRFNCGNPVTIRVEGTLVRV